jgi:spore coat protein U-like protein
MKKSLRIKAKSTSALTALVAVVMICQSTANAAATTSTANLVVTTNITHTCSIAAGTLGFGAYANDATALNSTIQTTLTSTCSTGAPHGIYISTAVDGVGYWNMGTNGGLTANELIQFSLYTNSDRSSEQITTNVQIVSATGAGSATAVKTLYGKILTGQSGKNSGSYTKTLTLDIRYGS